MDINTDQLRAFLTVHKLGSFTKAARELLISQSALSQKIARLEELLQTDLFTRGSKELSLTSSGEKLIQFALDQIEYQDEFLKNFDANQVVLGGNIRVAAFSSITRSVVIPALERTLKENSHLNIEFSSHEMFELEDRLKHHHSDFILTDYKPVINGIESEVVGLEEYVVIEAKKKKLIKEHFLDHGPKDNATESYFKFQKINFKNPRRFMGDVYGIVDGVKLGLGRAVMSKHIIKDDKEIKIIPYPKKYTRKIYLTHLKKNYYSKSFQLTKEKLIEGCRVLL